MNKSKFFTAVITILISTVVLIIIINMLFNNNKFNEGSFRISDTIITSIVELKDKSDDKNSWKYDISQNNKISMLVKADGNTKIKEIYLEKVKIKSKKDVNIYIEQDDLDQSYKYEKIKNNKVNIYADEKENGNYLIEFDLKNENIISDFIVPNEIKEIRHDGTILNIANIAVSDITFKSKYNLVIVDDKGNVNRCKVEIEVPNKSIAVDGMVVERMDSSDFYFKVNY